ncbi:unnamed protein product [Effrenium voratum]|nr:unnamed protein product [Effrenium voratum]
MYRRLRLFAALALPKRNFCAARLSDLEKALERQALRKSERQRAAWAAVNEKVLELRPEKKSPPRLEDVSTEEALPDPLRLLFAWHGTSRERPGAGVVEALLAKACQHLEAQRSALLELPLQRQMVVVGDIHGQLPDVLHIFQTHGPPSRDRAYLFNGDISDRGVQAVEAWILVLSFMMRYPGQVHVLRGNHENEQLNERARSFGGGFAEECLAKYGPRIYERFQQLFLLLPLFAVIERKIFVVHGGLFRTPEVTLERLKQLPYRRHYPLSLTEAERARGKDWTEDEKILFDAQWADPVEQTGVTRSSRGSMVTNFGPDVTQKFLKDNGLSLCIRSHQVPKTMQGFELLHDRRLLTVFSASHYGGRYRNAGGVAILHRGDGQPERFSLSMRLGGLQLHCAEHALGAGFSKVAESATKGLALFDQGAAQAAARQDALALVCFNREDILRRCAAVANEGIIDFQLFEDILKELCSPHVDPVRIFSKNVPTEVDFQELLAAVKERAQHLGSFIAPEGQELSFAAIIDRLLRFAPRRLEGAAAECRPLREGPLARVETGGLLRWAAPSDGSPYTALLRFFQAFDEDCDGVLSIEEAVQGLRQVQESPGGFLEQMRGIVARRPGLNQNQLRDLAEQLDANNSGTLSFLELARGLRDGPELEAEDSSATPVSQRTACAILEHREALLRGCRSLDEGSGQVAPEDFLALLRAADAEAALGLELRQPVAYVEMLSSFEVVLDQAAALKSIRSAKSEWRLSMVFSQWRGVEQLASPGCPTKPKAKEAKNRERSRSRSRSGGGGGGRQKRPEDDYGVDTLKITDDDAAFILGKGGKTKEKIAKVAEAEIELFERDLILEIRGSKMQRKRAKKYCEGVMAQRTGPVSVTDDYDDDDLTLLQVPQEAVGFVTGRAGNFLRSIEDQWTTLMFFCEVDKGRGRDKAFEKLAIFGTIRARRGAELLVLSAVETKVPGYFGNIRDEVLDRDRHRDATGTWSTDTMQFQDDELSYALGKQGGTRKKLERSSGAVVQYVGQTALFSGPKTERKRAKEYMKWLFMQLEGPVWVDNWEERDDITVLDIPSDCIGYVTGSRRAALGGMEEEWGTLMFFMTKPGSVTGGKGDRRSGGPGFGEQLAILGPERGRRGAARKPSLALERLLIFSVDSGSKTSEKGRAAAERLVNEMIQAGGWTGTRKSCEGTKGADAPIPGRAQIPGAEGAPSLPHPAAPALALSAAKVPVAAQVPGWGGDERHMRGDLGGIPLAQDLPHAKRQRRPWRNVMLTCDSLATALGFGSFGSSDRIPPAMSKFSFTDGVGAEDEAQKAILEKFKEAQHFMTVKDPKMAYEKMLDMDERQLTAAKEAELLKPIRVRFTEGPDRTMDGKTQYPKATEVPGISGQATILDLRLKLAKAEDLPLEETSTSSQGTRASRMTSGSTSASWTGWAPAWMIGRPGSR